MWAYICFKCEVVKLKESSTNDLRPLLLISVVGYKETAFMYAIRSAAVSFYVTQACSQGNLSSCGCDKNLWDGRSAPQGWKWGGCSANYKYGLHFSRMFLDAKEIEEDSRSLMNLHNNRAGRKVSSKRLSQSILF